MARLDSRHTRTVQAGQIAPDGIVTVHIGEGWCAWISQQKIFQAGRRRTSQDGAYTSVVMPCCER